MAKRRDRKEMCRLLSRRRRRGLSWSELSADSGVPVSTLCWWHRTLRGELEQSRDGRFVELVTRAPAPVAAESAVEIVLSRGCRIVVRPGFDVEHLRRVVEALGS